MSEVAQSTPVGPTTPSQTLAGARATLPVLVAVLPFGVVFGAVAVERGWSPAQALLASATIYAGASQYVMLDLVGQGVPAWSIVLTVFAVNFRHVLYSAALGRRMGAFAAWQKALAFFLLVDPQYAVAEARARTTGLRPAFYFGYGTALWTAWMTANAAGVAFGALISNPAAWGLDLILPLYFLALVVGLRGADRFAGIVAVSALAALVAFHWAGTPWHILAGGLAGMAHAALAAHRSAPGGPTPGHRPA